MGDSGQQFPGGAAGSNQPGATFDSTAFRSAETSGLGLPEGFGIPEPKPPRKLPKDRRPLILAGFGALALVMIALVVASLPKSKADADDWGEGVFHAAALRGHLVTRWDGKAQYQLEIKPIDPRQNTQFAYVAGNPPGPLYLNIRLLDQAGFAVCGKQVLFAFDPAKSAPAPIPDAGPRARKAVAERIAREQAAQRATLQSQQAQEQAREHGNDILQNELGEDGTIVSVNAAGTLPCSREQYKRIYYWDFATNFPTVDEQDALMHHEKETQARKAYEARMAARRRNAAASLSAFYVEGEDRATGYETARNLLETADRKRFFIGKRSDQAVAAGWAADSSLIHYKCDQHANCALKHAGTVLVIYGSLNE